MATVWIGLGSNLGDRAGQIVEAVEAMSDVLQIQGLSRLYETAPMYVTDQPPFLNAAVRATTDHGPLSLLRSLKALELSLGRKPRERNGPRELDLDLLAFGSLRLKTAKLELPHPRLGERRFVVLPLSEVSPFIPSVGLLADLVEQTRSQEADVVAVEDPAWENLRRRFSRESSEATE